MYAPDGHTVLPLLNITASTFSNAKDIAMTPMQQLSVIMHANADGILHPAIKLIDDKRISYEFIWE